MPKQFLTPAFAGLLLIAGLLAGCGQKGPLTRPQTETGASASPVQPAAEPGAQ